MGGEGGWWPQDREEPPQPAPGRRPPGGASSGGGRKRASRYSVFVGLAFTAIAAVALINLLRNDDAGIIGTEPVEGRPVAEFAVPDAFGDLEGDANIYQDDCSSSLNPCPEGDRRVPACEIDPAGAIRICDLFDKPLAISFWFTRGGDCVPTQDAFDEVARRYPGRVNFLSINVRDDRDTVTSIARQGGWKVPVGLDPDGAVSNLLQVGVCPTIVLAYPGGILQGAEVRGGNFDVTEIDGFIHDLLRASRERAGASR